MIPTYFSGMRDITIQAQAYGLAANYCVYREACVQYLAEHPDTAVIPQNALQLPRGYVYLEQWRTTIIGNYCYIYGPIDEDEIYIIRERLGNSMLVGLNTNGRLNPSGVTVPANIPLGQLVSIVSIP